MTEGAGENRGISRRNFLLKGAAVGVAAVAAKELDVIGKAGEFISYHLDTPYRKYLVLENGKPVISKDPLPPINVSFMPLGGISKYWNEDKIRFREGPDQNSKDYLISPKDIKTQYAVRVFGSSFSGYTEGLGKLTTIYNDKEYNGGEWFMLTDEKGTPVKPDGTPLRKNENPYYTAANFVTVIPKTAK